jgi:hypothetical protein
MYFKIILSLILITLFSCKVGYVKKNNDAVHHISCVKNNVCKSLTQDVVLYAIFVDTKYTNSWTEYDMASTLDSIKMATNWIEQQAKKEGIPLNIKVDYHQSNDEIVPLKANFLKRTLSGTLFSSNGIRNVDRWADKLAKAALKTYGPDKSKKTRTKLVPKDRDKLIARLRDIHKTDNVGLLYFINNYYTDEISVVLHSHADHSPEYGIVSYKNPGTIAHEYLHLYGAIDLYLSPFDKKRAAKKKKAFAMKEFPDEIMAFPHRRLNTLSISPFTKYLVGWDTELQTKYKNMLIGKKVRVAKY